MRWGIRNQILLPFAVVLLAAVALTAFSAAYLAAERSERDINDRLNRVMKTLGRSEFPYSQNVLEMMRGLSGAEFVVCDRDGTTMASTLGNTVTLDAEIRREITTDNATMTLTQRPVIEVDNRRYFAAGYRRISPRGRRETLVVLYPEEQLRAARREAAMPPLVVGGFSLLAMAAVSAWLAGRMGRRIRNVQRQVAQIAAGDFRKMPLGPTRDEIFELVQSVNQMAERLRGLQETIERTERSRLLGQLAGGLAHQLRNAVTGAKLAIQIHQRRCTAAEDGESLDVALRQLALTEEYVQSLLSVGKPERRASSLQPLRSLLEDVAALVSPLCGHEDVSFSWELADGAEAETVPESLHSAVLNLTLNAVEAAGPIGKVQLRAFSQSEQLVIEVSDNGPGPPKAVQDQIFEAFVTGKSEGVGLGLAVVKQVAAELGGSVNWQREQKQTVFRLQFPRQSSGIDQSVDRGGDVQESPSVTGRLTLAARQPYQSP